MATSDEQLLSCTAIDRIGNDFRTRQPPFNKYQAPERDAFEQIDFWTYSTENQLRFLTFGAALDYQRDADLHWEEMADLFDNRRHYLFVPTQIVPRGVEHLQNIFGDRRIRFPNRDAGTWMKISKKLDSDYDGQLLTLLTTFEYDAAQLYERIRDGGFPFLGGDKIAPFWIRLVHEHVIELDNVNEIDIPVDVQLRIVTNHLAPSTESDDEARQYWSDACSGAEFAPLELDEPLWLIGRNFDDWGKEYLDTIQ